MTLKLICKIFIIFLSILIITNLEAKYHFNENDTLQCLTNINIKNSDNNVIEVTDNTIRKLQPHFFGFNLNWVGFQHSYWNYRTKSINDSVVNFLRETFHGAIYRYPGGSVSNRFDWQSSVGSILDRQKQKAVDWKPPIVAEFGFKEYMDFVDSVNGYPWIVTNLQGNFYKEIAIDVLADNAKHWAEYSQHLRPSIVRWELGNELDRLSYKWTPKKYSKRAIEVANAIKDVDDQAKFVSILRDYNIKGHGSANDYNMNLIHMIKNIKPDYALHQYYDSPTGWGAIPKRLKHLCSSIGVLRKSTNDNPAIWITEHARARTSKTNENSWKKHYSKTFDLQSAISVSDYLIALTHLPDVEGAFIHSLAVSDGPWAMFHSTKKGIKPSIVYSALKILRDSMLDEVLETSIKSQNHSDYRGGYDIRASVQTNPERNRYSIWIVNRANEDKIVTLKIPKLASKHTDVVVTSLYNKDLHINNMQKAHELAPISNNVKLTFNNKGEGRLSIPHQAITTVIINSSAKGL
jgi:alpha-L-arabinofuranosidase